MFPSKDVILQSLSDMLGDTNRLGVFDPDGFGVGRNVVGSGAAITSTNGTVPTPGTLALLGLGLVGLGLLRRRSRMA